MPALLVMLLLPLAFSTMRPALENVLLLLMTALATMWISAVQVLFWNVAPLPRP